jgi:hypothetical protein
MARKVATAAASDVEVVSKPGLSLDEGIVLTTFFLLAAAVTLVWFASRAYN